MRLTRRDLLLGAAALGLAACGPKNSKTRALELWTLQLAPKFNPYFADVLGDWSRLHPGATRGSQPLSLRISSNCERHREQHKVEKAPQHLTASGLPFADRCRNRRWQAIAKSITEPPSDRQWRFDARGPSPFQVAAVAARC